MDNKSERGILSLRVLLVESDDSTRLLVAALLRKCSYKVVAVSDGLKAWETLKARPHNIDLILTEVDLPSISGYALLTLIMEHDICKHIPVIMTSSQDSISLVLRCMSRGAVDFLVKPIRKNEITNLWQHVWRRQTSGQKTEHKACAGKDLSSYNVNGGDRRNEKSLQLIGKSLLPASETQAKPCGSGSEVISREETNISTLSSLGEDPMCARSLTSDATKCLRSDLELVEPSAAIDYISEFKDYSGNINGCSSAECVVDELMFLELSLRRPSPNAMEGEGTVEQQILNHSNASAFSRYDNTKTLQSHSVANQNVHAEATVADYQIKMDTIYHNYIPPESYTRSGPSSDVLCDQPRLPSNRLLCFGFDNQDDTSTKSEQIVKEKDNTVDDSDSGPSVAVTKSSVSEGLNYSPTLFQERTVMDSYSPSQREAALQKFRLKRKDRCFDKKVRYQSRKRLAEQRPRVKGQFIRQVKDEASLADGCVLPSRLFNLDF